MIAGHTQTVARVPLQVSQPHFVEVLVVAASFRRTEGPLAAPPQVLLEPVTNVPVDLPKRDPGIPKAEVVCPSIQVPVEALNQYGKRHVRLVDTSQ